MKSSSYFCGYGEQRITTSRVLGRFKGTVSAQKALQAIKTEMREMHARDFFTYLAPLYWIANVLPVLHAQRSFWFQEDFLLDTWISNPLDFLPYWKYSKRKYEVISPKNTNNDKYCGKPTGVCPKLLARYVFRTGGIKVGHINNYFKKPLDKGPCLWNNFYVLIGNVWKAVSLEFNTSRSFFLLWCTKIANVSEYLQLEALRHDKLCLNLKSLLILPPLVAKCLNRWGIYKTQRGQGNLDPQTSC